MLRHLPLPCVLGLVLILAGRPVPAQAQGVQRCLDAAGRAVFTDQRCADVGAVSQLPSSPAPGATATGALRRGPMPGGCPRTAAQLAGELGAAVRASDSNRLAGLYDWVGVSGARASRVLDQLERIAARPLVDIAPVLAGGFDHAEPAPAMDEPPPGAATVAPHAGDEPAPEGPARWLPSWMQLASDEPGQAGPARQADAMLASAAPLPAAMPRPRTVGLRLEQTLPASATPARTVFSMQRRFGCLWLRL